MSKPGLPLPAETETSAVLKMGGVRLALPQREVCAVGAASDVGVSDDLPPFSVGWVVHAERRWPVYCLSPELSLELVVPAEYHACAVLDAGSGFVGILCEEVSTVQLAATQRHELPPAMRTAHTPVLSLVALDDGELACATHSERLGAHVSRLMGL